MKTNTTSPSLVNQRDVSQHNAGEPSPVPLNNYALPLETFRSTAGKKKNRNEIWYHHTIRFVSFTGSRLTLTITHVKESYTLTLLIQAQQLTVSCSCKSSAAALCIHTYEYLFNVARTGGECAFTDFTPGGGIETALSRKPYFTIHSTGNFSLHPDHTAPTHLSGFASSQTHNNRRLPSAILGALIAVSSS